LGNKDFEQIYVQYKQDGAHHIQQESSEPTESVGEKIIAVRKNGDDDIIAFKTESGRELDYLTALDEAKSGKLAHVDVFHRYGRDIIRSEPDGIEENNLNNLPHF
jgi:S-adenosylmethionine:tRNA-ribosyltransferase-isomerase (queuine synthetase)